ncbi:MAG: hypothetical protein CMM05_04430, partial [Rhodopirellula sp.]|nr:hypothetical protein [Rhodopirellula sp.]
MSDPEGQTEPDHGRKEILQTENSLSDGVATGVASSDAALGEETGGPTEPKPYTPVRQTCQPETRSPRELRPPVGNAMGVVLGLSAAVLYTLANIALRQCVAVDPFLVSAVKAAPTVIV